MIYYLQLLYVILAASWGLSTIWFGMRTLWGFRRRQAGYRYVFPFWRKQNGKVDESGLPVATHSNSAFMVWLVVPGCLLMMAMVPLFPNPSTQAMASNASYWISMTGLPGAALTNYYLGKSLTHGPQAPGFFQQLTGKFTGTQTTAGTPNTGGVTGPLTGPGPGAPK